MVLTRLVLGPEVTTASAMRAGCYRKRLEEGTAAVKRTESLSRATNPGPTQRGWHEAKRRRGKAGSKEAKSVVLWRREA
jgi:hypothetical protein